MRTHGGVERAVSPGIQAPDRPGIWWVDDLGAWNPADPKGNEPWSRRSIRGTLEHSLAAYTLLGMAKVLLAPRCVAIKWDLRQVAPESLEAVLDYLDGRRGDRRRVRLSFYFDGWSAEDHDGAAAAIRRIRQVSAYRDLCLADRVWVKPRELDQVSRAAPLLQAGFAAWERSGGRLDPARHPQWHEILPRLLVFCPAPNGDGLELLQAGDRADCIKVMDAGWETMLRGHSPDAPGRRFRERISPAYARALASGEPWHDHVRALIPRARREALWTPYQRLLLPVTLANGAPAIASLCRLSQEIAIPFLGMMA